MARPPRISLDGAPKAPSPVLTSAHQAPVRRVIDGDELLVPPTDPLGPVFTPSASDAKGVALSAFLDGIGRTLRKEHSMPVWVQAEVAFVQSKSKGYWVLGLYETDVDGNKLASADAMIWAQDVPRVIGLFERSTGQSLSAGMKILLRVEVSFSAQWGLRLLAKGIDPSWTLGQAVQAQDRVRQALQEEGLWDTNRKRPAPVDFTHVAVLAPDGSAGLEDFLREAHTLQELGLCRFTTFTSPFEGPNAVLSLPMAFAQIASHPEPFDAVCVVRGGGAAAGIAWLNHEAIVRAAASCPYPLLTGIGHERDVTLIDEVAHTAAGTPSKAIGFIVTQVRDRALAAERAWTEILSRTREKLLTQQSLLAAQMTEIAQRAEALLAVAKQEVDSLWREGLGLGPQATLERGYTLAQASDGSILSTAQAALQAGSFRLRFQDGELTVKTPSPRKSRTSS